MMRGLGSGYRSKSRRIRSQGIEARCERRFSHLRHTSIVSRKKRAIASKFAVMPKYPK